jgi:hypothetical protein
MRVVSLRAAPGGEGAVRLGRTRGRESRWPRWESDSALTAAWFDKYLQRAATFYSGMEK